jgi:hypothetical protein
LLNAWIDGEIQHESDEPQRSAANAFMKDRVTLP